MKLYIDTPDKLQPIDDLAKGFVIGLNEHNQVQFTAIGKTSFEDSLDLHISSLAYILKTFNHQTNNEHTKQIYDRAVEAFSLMIHEFLPEVKDPEYVPENR